MAEIGIVAIASVVTAALDAYDVARRGPPLASPPRVRAIDHAMVMMRLVRPEMTPGQAHDLWYHLKLDAFWRGGPYNPIRKTHPSLRPYAEIEPADRLKAVLARAIVNALGALIDPAELNAMREDILADALVAAETRHPTH